MNIPKYLLVILLIYCGTSMIHFTHNAEFISEYPNLPLWLTRSKVYFAWLAVTTVGVAGLVFLRLGLRSLGLLFITGYAALGFAGLDHYWAAPIWAHSLAANATIWFETAAAAILFVTAGILLFRSAVTAPASSDL